MGAPIGGQSQGGEEGLFVGGYTTKGQVDGIDREVDDAGGNRPSQPGLNFGQKVVGEGGNVVGVEAGAKEGVEFLGSGACGGAAKPEAGAEDAEDISASALEEWDQGIVGGSATENGFEDGPVSDRPYCDFFAIRFSINRSLGAIQCKKIRA